VLKRDLFADVGVVEPELVAAVMTHGHGSRPQTHDLDVVRVTTVGSLVEIRVRAVGVITSVHRDKRCSHDGVRTVRTHGIVIGRLPSND